MFIIWPNRKSKGKKYICSPARAQAFSWLTSVTSLQSKRDKNNCSKYSFVQPSSMNKDKITVVFLQAQWKFSKMRPKVQQIVMPVCAMITQRSVLIQLCDLWLIATENVNIECAALKLVNMCSGKNCLRLDLLDCEDILLSCSGGTDLVFFELSGCIWSTIQDGTHFSLSLERGWMVAVEAFQIFMTT